MSEGDGVTPLLTVSAKPTFVHVQGPSSWQGGHQPRSLFVSTAVEFPDPNQPMAAEEDIDAFYETLVPQLVFVRAVCGEFCWHGARGTARLIIDDPVLRRVYGYLDFARLFESVRRHGYAASVAYIPWNYTRTQKDRAAFFRAAGAQFSLCVHGCDHTNDEYGGTAEVYLSQKSSLAMDRMRRHEARTGMSFEPVMVFPQGRFSTAGLRGLRSSGFLAAINSSRFPVDVDAAPLSLWDLLEPASLRPHGLPVFRRHYVEPTFPLVFDLFLGRPAFIVEHHEFFKSGFPTMEALADRLNEVEPGLLWGSLSDAVKQACWKRAVSDTSWEVRFFTDRFVMSNDSDRRVSYRLLKEEPERDAVESASINARTVTPDRAGGQIIFELTLDPGETARVELRPSAGPARAGVSEGKVYASKVLMRRALSEFRDEFLVKHPVMLASAKRIVRVLKASSDSLPRPGAERTVSR